MDARERDLAHHLLQRLHARGVQVWHNRGRLYAAPWGQVTPSEREELATLRPALLFCLQRWPMFPDDAESLVAPCPRAEGSYAGKLPRPPWGYDIAVVLPTFGDLDLVETAIHVWRQQTVSPYFVVIDTGSRPATLDAVFALRTYDCEVHAIRSHGWRHSSSPVSAALDVAFAVCQQNAALLTHVDVFPRHANVLENLLSRLAGSCPVVGYQMSKRIGSEEWRQCVSHTLTAVDLRAMRAKRVQWNLLTALEQDDEVEQRFLGWPDTETLFSRACRAEGIVPQFLGPESNASVYQTDLIVHWRSAPSVRHYLPEQSDQRHPGLSEWLAETRRLGVAAPLPPELLQAVAIEQGSPAAR